MNAAQRTDCESVIWLQSRERADLLIVNGPKDLLDIEILETQVEPIAPPQTPRPKEVSHEADDPAILSYGRPPQQDATTRSTDMGRGPLAHITTKASVQTGLRTIISTSDPQGQHSPLDPQLVKQDSLAEAGQLGPQCSSRTPQLASRNSAQRAYFADHGETSATLIGPFEELGLNDGYKERDKGQDDATCNGKKSEADIAVARKFKRRRPKRGPRKELAEEGAAERVEVSQQGTKGSPASRRTANRQPKKSGWRETPFLEEAPQSKRNPHALRDPTPKGQSQRQRRQKAFQDVRNGWATEDATDIQDMVDFDFTGNLSKFDKTTTFSQFKREDTTADEERLVTHNRLPPRPGTGGGKNLHYTENVLNSPKVSSDVGWNSGDSENDNIEANDKSGRSSRRDTSRASIPRHSSRKGSAMTSEQHMTGSGSLPGSRTRTRQTPRGSINSGKIHDDVSTSHDTIRRTAHNFEKPASRIPRSARSKPSFRLTHNNHVCPCLTPLQMLELEQLAITELGMTEEMLTENAARAITAAINTVLLDQTDDNPNNSGHDASATIVILAGNNRSGARAIAAARQALNHHSHIFLTVLGLERDDDLLDAVRRQLSIYRNCGGQVVKPNRLIRALGKLKPDIIIDALLGMHMAFEDLRADGQATYMSLAHWANKAAPVMAIDIPSGSDASSGMVFFPYVTQYCVNGSIEVAAIAGGADLVIHADVVLSLGAPKTGLLRAMDKAGADRMEHIVADIGISNKVWQKLGTRFKDGVQFPSEWVVGIEYTTDE